ncbi:MAG: RNA polymerase sigma factor [Bacteroidia bacterium]|nr:RNA polymerase sigma factor [Bacteroidia bacterium]
MDARTDEEIIGLVLDGDVQAFRHLIDRHKGIAYSTAFAVTRNHEDAEEIVQDAFLKAFTSLGSFQGRSKFSTWLFRIVYHRALNHIEKYKSYKTNTDLDFKFEKEDDLITQEREKLVRKEQELYIGRALEKLNAPDRLSLSLYYLDEKSQQEISQLTGWSLAATKGRIHRARSKFDEALEKILGNEKDSLL